MSNGVSVCVEKSDDVASVPKAISVDALFEPCIVTGISVDVSSGPDVVSVDVAPVSECISVGVGFVPNGVLVVFLPKDGGVVSVSKTVTVETVFVRSISADVSSVSEGNSVDSSSVL